MRPAIRAPSRPTTPKRTLYLMKKSVSLPLILLATVTLLLIVALGCDATSNEQPSGIPLKIGLLLNFTGSPEASADRQRAFDLAIQHVNEAEVYSECQSKASLPVLAYVKETYDATVALAPTPPAAPQALRWRSDLRRP